MKHEAPAQTGNPSESSSRLIGFSVLTIIVVFAAAWLYVQGKEAIAPAHSTQTLPPFDDAILARFRADAWYLPNDASLGFVEVPAGPFVMGSDPDIDAMAFGNEQWSKAHNQGTVTLAAFAIGRYEVTVAQFRAFVEATGFHANEQALRGVPDHPVTNVSWTDALAYSRWLEAQLKQSPHTPASLQQHLHNGWRVTLPNEAQLEKAARGTDGRLFPWGNAPTREYANFHGTSTMPVGSFACAPCAFGLADMSGNAWELTRSAYQPYPFDPKRALELNADALFVMRGGSFNDADNTVRAAVRGGIDPGARRPFIGFRVAITQD